MATHTDSTVVLARSGSLGLLAERLLVVGIVLVFGLGAYAKLHARAGDTVAQENLAAILPLAHAYAIDQGGYEGMTLGSLERSYSPELDTSLYRLFMSGTDAYCIETTRAGRTWHVTVPTGDQPELGACPSGLEGSGP